MKKISLVLGFVSLLAVPILVSAQVATTTSTGTSASKVSCVQNAIEKRDSSIISGHNTFNTSIVQALTVRKDSLKAAYALEDRTAAKEAKKAAWTTFGTAQKNAHDSLRTIRKTSWNNFNTEMRACGVKHDESPRAVLNPTSSL